MDIRTVIIMTPEEIREVVRITLDELEQRKYTNVHKKVSDKLTAFFNNDEGSTDVFKALLKLANDPYLDIIYSHYRDGLTLETIADKLEKDVSTIKRNKKRLILKINELLGW